MIRIENLQKVIGSQTVLDIESLQVESGEIGAIVGPAGSGITHLLEVLIAKSGPSAGLVHLDNQAPNRNEISRTLGVLFETDGLYLRQTARQNLAFQARLFGLKPGSVPEMLEQVGLADHADIRAEKLSTGLARRLAFGRALLHDPQVLILVEPFTRCDEGSISLIGRRIREKARAGAAVLILSADSSNLENLCDRIHLLNQGRIIETYKPQETLADAAPFKIPVRLEGRVLLVNPADILYADAGDGRTQIWTLEGPLPSQFTLQELEQRLERRGFFRAHRSYLVNLQHVKEVIPYTRNSFSLRLNDEAQTKIPLSKSAAAELREMLDY
jgi:ABC-2 type transport system ATP-binding protein